MNNTYRSALFSDTINIAQITNSTKLKGNIYHFERIDSTSSWLEQHGNAHDICISDMQTAGRGRRGNQWISPHTGNIYFSMMWNFDEPLHNIKHQSLLGLVVGIAIADALQEVGLRHHGIKWPNDIFWKQMKMGGILIESLNQSNAVIIGIGLNIYMPEDHINQIDQNVCSLSEAIVNQQHTEQKYADQFSRNKLVISMIQNLQKQLQYFSKMTFDAFQSGWQKWDILKNNRVCFTHQGEEVVGRVSGLDRHGRLGLTDDFGALKYYSSAEIKLRKPE